MFGFTFEEPICNIDLSSESKDVPIYALYAHLLTSKAKIFCLLNVDWFLTNTSDKSSTGIRAPETVASSSLNTASGIISDG